MQLDRHPDARVHRRVQVQYEEIDTAMLSDQPREDATALDLPCCDHVSPV